MSIQMVPDWKVDFLKKGSRAIRLGVRSCSNLLSRGCSKIQIIDKEIAEAVQVISAEEIFIIRQLIEYYQKIMEKQLKEIKEFSKQDNQQKRKTALLDSESGHFDYGIEEWLEKKTSSKQMAVDVEATKVNLHKA